MTELRRSSLAQYAVVTGSYWAFTLTDGALRMLVVLYFHQLGYSPLEVAMLFLLYEFFGMVTNLLGGWLAAVTGLTWTLVLGLSLQDGGAADADGGTDLVDRPLRHGRSGPFGHCERSV